MTTDLLKIEVEPIKQSRISEVDFNHIEFGKNFADHMLLVDFKDGAWQTPKIMPYGHLPMSPSTSAFHYGQAIFEGMKAYKNAAGEVSLFRPLDNWKRLNASAVRMCMPEIPEEHFMEGLMELLRLDQAWVPSSAGCALYLRPFMIGTDEFVGVRPSSTYKFMIFSCPVSAYYPAPLKVRFEERFVRATDGGAGFAKAAGNYGAALYPTKLAQDEGYQQLIWTDGHEHQYIEESGTMNVMFVINGTLITPNLDGVILAGITRDSVLTLARDWGMPVEERRVSLHEVIAAIKNGTLSEAFGTGTAATIAQIATIGFKGTDYELPPVAGREFSKKVGTVLDQIKTGILPDSHNWMVKVS